MITFPDAGERACLDALLNSVTTFYHLFVNDLVPGPLTVKADFVEPIWPAYSPKAVTSWTPALTVNGRAVATADQALWTRGPIGPPGLVYGYFVTDGSSGPLLWCERRPSGPLPMQLPTQAVLLLPRITLAECLEGPGLIQGGGDLVMDGSSTVDALLVQGGGDLVMDGSSTLDLPPASGGGDLVMDGEGVASVASRSGGGDLVGDGEGDGWVTVVGEGDLVADGEGTAMVTSRSGFGDLILDGEGTPGV